MAVRSRGSPESGTGCVASISKAGLRRVCVEFLTASETEIRCRATGPYWRWYFRLTDPVQPINDDRGTLTHGPCRDRRGHIQFVC